MTAKCRCASLRCTGTGGCSASFTACVCMIAVDAAQTNRTAAYFEYPSIVAILQREIRYGIEVDFAHVTVNPLMSKPGPFAYHVGNVNVDYKPSGVSTVDVPAAPGVQKEHRLHGMVANGEYTISAGGSCALTADAAMALASPQGVLTFVADGSCAGGVRVAFRGA